MKRYQIRMNEARNILSTEIIGGKRFTTISEIHRPSIDLRVKMLQFKFSAKDDPDVWISETTGGWAISWPVN